MNWIETEYSFQIKSDAADTYLEDVTDDCTAYVYGFSNIPQLKALLAEKLPNAFTEREITEICRQTFRSKPEKRYDKTEDADRHVVDFIYQF